MPQPLIVGMTPDIIVSGAYRIRLTALSPTDGSTVSGVKVSLGAVSARNLVVNTVETPPEAEPPNPLLVPTEI